VALAEPSTGSSTFNISFLLVSSGGLPLVPWLESVTLTGQTG